MCMNCLCEGHVTNKCKNTNRDCKFIQHKLETKKENRPFCKICFDSNDNLCKTHNTYDKYGGIRCIRKLT